MDNLREDQIAYVNEAARLLKNGHRRIVLEMPTGGGKTRIAFAIAKLAARRGGRVLFTSPRLSLLSQTSRRAGSDEGNLSVGLYHGDCQDIDGYDIIVTTNQTLCSRAKKNEELPDCSTMIIDECHTGVASSKDMKAVIAYYCKLGANIIGLSATPWSEGMGAAMPEVFEGEPDPRLFQAKVRLSGPQAMIKSGIIVPCRLFAPLKVDLSGVKSQRDKDGDMDYKVADLSKVVDAKVVAKALEWWTKLAKDKKTIVFCVDVDHARCVADEFIKAEVPAELIHGYMDHDTQQAIIDRFKRGVTRVMVNPLLLREGLDVTDIECVLWLRPTRNLKLWVQAAGRAARAHPGKKEYLLIDCCGTSEQLGFPDDDHKRPLHDGKAKVKPYTVPGEKKPLICKACHAVIRKRCYPCDECGYAPSLASKIQEFEAEMVEIRKDGRYALATPDQRQRLADLLGGNRIYDHLAYIARLKGYKPGWAYYKTKELFKVEPAYGYRARPTAPSPELMKFYEDSIRKARARDHIIRSYRR